MGDIIYNFSNSMLGKPVVYIERIVDEHETQKLRFRHEKESWLATETGNSLHLFGRDEDGNIIEVEIPISISDLKNALEKYLG